MAGVDGLKPVSRSQNQMMPESVAFGVVFIKKKRATFVALILEIKPRHAKGYAPSPLFYQPPPRDLYNETMLLTNSIRHEIWFCCELNNCLCATSRSRNSISPAL